MYYLRLERYFVVSAGTVNSLCLSNKRFLEPFDAKSEPSFLSC
jgi:hypothetical protein